MTKENIQEILAEKTINWPVKKDVVDFDYKKALLEYTQSDEAKPQSLYYSSFTTKYEWHFCASGTYIDSSKGVSVTLFYNYSILSLVQLALDYSSGAEQDQFILNVKDRRRYVNDRSQYYSEWEKDNTYCYYTQLPLDLSQKREILLRDDILRWLKVLGIQARKKIKHVNGQSRPEYIITERAPLSIRK
ncbi:MAG: hypothetical protein WDO71_08800 [Bacteroidota bacterium]